MSTAATSSPSILILGAGIFGTSTAYHLSRKHPSPSKITVVDRSPFPPHQAASTDINKIVRADYTSRFYMELAYEALEAWKTWPVLQNAGKEEAQRFFHESGWVMLSNSGNDLAQRIRRNLRERGTDVTQDKVVDEDLRKEWGGMLEETVFEGIEASYWNPEAGWADAADAVQAMMEEAVGRGVKYESCDVEGVILGEDGVKGVRGKDGKVFEADRVVLATGAWTSALMSGIEDELDLKEEDRVEKQVTAAGVCVVHYELTPEEFEKQKNTPVLIYGDKGEMIRHRGRTQLLKFTNAKSFSNTITTTTGHRISVPPDRDQTIVSEQLKQETLNSIVRHVKPSFATRPVSYWRLCWDSITPTQDQLITRHPHQRLSNLYLAVGGSFHSWKFLPIIGSYILNVIDGVSNGEEKDEHWKWKTERPTGRGAHEKVVPKRELRDLED